MAINLVSALWRVPKTVQISPFLRIIRKSHFLRNDTRLCRRYPNRETICCSIFVPVQIQTRGIKVSDPKRALHPLIVVLLRPLSKFLSVISGMIIKRWWRNLPPEEKEKVLERIRKRQAPIAAASIFAMLVFIMYYYDHVVEVPLTKRKRFMMLDNTVMNKIAEMSLPSIFAQFKNEIVPVTHPFYQRTARVTNAILLANRDLPEVRQQNWKLFVVDKPEIVNAFCLPNGKIFVFTGILNICTNDDQLAVVLSHEISHTILSHAAETMSKKVLIEAVLFIPSLICWVMFADLWALMSEFFTKFLSNILVSLPHSRSMEREADWIGLYLAAKSCFDVREAPGLWSKMSAYVDPNFPAEWLSTHPSSETRHDDLLHLLPGALKVRSESNCPSLRLFGNKLILRHVTW